VVLTEITTDSMNKTLQDTRMYRRIRSIKDSMMVVGGRGTDALDHLVSSERKLLKEGVLLKACRAKNKPFMFWLFNNCLLYATPMGTLGGSKYQYQFNRVMMLIDCFLRESREDPRSFELLSGEKSFALWCETVGEAKEWASALRDAIQDAREAKGLKPDDVRDMVAAPLWVQESEATACNVCQEAFGWAIIVGGRQKHHCRSCGQVVCGSCSGYQLLLPNIHKTRKQRACVVCFKGGKPVLGLEDVSASMAMSAGGSKGSNGSEGSAASLGGSLGEQPPTVFAQPTQPLPRPLPTLTKAKTAASAMTAPSVRLPRPVPPKKPARRSSAVSVVPGGCVSPATSTSAVVTTPSAAKAEGQQSQQHHSRSHSRPLSTRLSSSSSRKSLALPPPSPAPFRNPPPPPPAPSKVTASSSPEQEQEGGASGTQRVGGMLDELMVGMQRRRELLMTRGGEGDVLEQEVEEGGGGKEGAAEGGSRLIRARSSDSGSDGWDD